MTVVIAAFLPILAIISLFPAVPAMIDHFSSDPAAQWKVPSMVTAPGLTIAIISLFAGMLVDRFGRRKLLLVATFFYGIFGVAPFFLESLNAVYGSRLLLGLSEAAILTTLNTLIADYWDERGRRTWLTVQGMAGPALSSVVLFFAGTLVEWRWNAIFLIYLVAFPIFVAMWRWMFEPKSDATARRMLGIGEEGITASGFPWPVMFGIGAVTLFSSFLYYVFIINGGLVWKELGVSNPEQIGQITALPSLFILAGAILFWLLGRWGVGSRGMIVTFLAILGAGLTIIGLAQDWRGMILGMTIQQTGAGMAIPVLIAWASKLLPFDHRGKGMGVWTACFFFGQFSSPLLVGLIRGMVGSMQGAFVVAGIIAVAGAGIAWLVLSLVRETKSEAA
ncbi:MFS transporter [Sphingomonas sp.]|uniref:MFS transporter n=1 Tax=Sphingomonas sp. TaxID=28214 RepID=UPI0025F27131|nr:MFS transporter [Sphingomonas sp.]